ncbi:4-hydroxy-tetrahydrodipicolinate reductase [Buchnera aphidicola]|uniref:4-hydroxy-tetrahydrodipicolinate reductase n=1 Tax=Buchnera aphidicola (Cinara strobi) TaxID=1921549 RepID=A0A3B1E9D4_9GAMM|nr:4-hydroxy-tetrahydrodipicolinate reductase [Buchnera aphidicola]VAX76359.1 4-hydroxy-tetrahydrodipicolinate reductase [Buchnera aphidicola (Cinara strobi)]
MKKEKMRIIISGAFGQMGQMLIKEIKKHEQIQLVHALINNIHKNSHQLKNSADFLNKKNFLLTLEDLKKNTNILPFNTFIDFSIPFVTMKIIKYCIAYKKKMIIGTTGFNKKQMKAIKDASYSIPILFSPNFSIGINILHQLLKYVSYMFDKTCDIEIIESHHRNKIDSPSGTALQLGKIICKNMKWDFNKSAIFSRKGNTGIRERKKIGFSTIRAGSTIGKHTVLFENRYEKISITHNASNRSIFAKGALEAAIWIQDKKNGLYSMKDVLSDTLKKRKKYFNK